MSATNATFSDGPFRFIVEDVFAITGRGNVFVGVVESGTVHVGSVVTVSTQMDNLQAMIVGIEKSHKKQQQTSAGDKAGLLLELESATSADRGAFRGAVIHS